MRRFVCGWAFACLWHGGLWAQSSPDKAMPYIDRSGGRPTLMVDGSPFLVLGAQVNNSSAWASSMTAVWPAMEALQVNTVEAPVYWESLEPQEGVFDFAQTDMLLTQHASMGNGWCCCGSGRGRTAVPAMHRSG